MEVANPVKAFLHKNNVDFVQYLLGQVSPTSPKDVWHLCHSGSTQWDSPCHPQTCNFCDPAIAFFSQSLKFFFPENSLFFISTILWYPNFHYTYLFTGSSSSPLLSLLLPSTPNVLYLFFNTSEKLHFLLASTNTWTHFNLPQSWCSLQQFP